MVDLSVNLAGLPLDNPVIPASGTFGFGQAFSRFYDLDCLGSFVFKGTTLAARDGNPLPRVAECASGMLNAVGLENPGVHAVVERELPALKTIFHKPVIANISGFSVAEYVECARVLTAEPQIGLLEVNISCPNVHGGGMSFGTDPALASRVTRAVREVSTKPVFVKLTPNVTDIADIARACADAGADGLSLINTVLGLRIDLKTRKPVLANGTGGLSGPCVFPIAVRMVRAVARAVRLPIMGMGGVSSARDVLELMLAGATAVQIGAMNLVDPMICRKILDDLPGLCESLGIRRLKDIIGGANA